MVEELKAPSQSRPHAYQKALHEAKTLTGLSEDSGVEDSDYSKLFKKKRKRKKEYVREVIKIISA